MALSVSSLRFAEMCLYTALLSRSCHSISNRLRSGLTGPLQCLDYYFFPIFFNRFAGMLGIIVLFHYLMLPVRHLTRIIWYTVLSLYPKVRHHVR